MNTVDLVIIVLFSILMSSVILLLVIMHIMMIPLEIELYFLCLKIENHPILRKKVDDVINKILKKEKIGIFHKSYEELNKNEPDENNKALGMYVYTMSQEHQVKLDNILSGIEELECKYCQSYEDMCNELNITNRYNKEELTLPRILLCHDELVKMGGYNSYYSTFFHEIGHHFAQKNIGEHTEDDANKFARQIILDELPFFFQLFPSFRFEYRLKLPKLSRKENIRASWEYWKYYMKNKKSIIKPNKKK